ncbi:MAG: hypothetical protein AB7V39_15315 [Nitrospiraceae bacterium]
MSWSWFCLLERLFEPATGAVSMPYARRRGLSGRGTAPGKGRRPAQPKAEALSLEAPAHRRMLGIMEKTASAGSGDEGTT